MCKHLYYNIYLHISQTPELDASCSLLSPISVTRVRGPSGRLPGASENQLSLRVLTRERKSSPLGPESIEKRLPSKPQSHSEGTRMALGGHFKTYGIYGVGATLDYFCRGRELILFPFIFQAPTFLDFW